MDNKKIDSPHGLLIHFLGHVEKYRGIIIIAVEEQANKDNSGIVMGVGNLSPHEILGALDAGLIMAEEDYRDSYLENGEEQDA
jgi:hypothetical protein